MTNKTPMYIRHLTIGGAVIVELLVGEPNGNKEDVRGNISMTREEWEFFSKAITREEPLEDDKYTLTIGDE